jgi:hypothetical protein
MLRNHGCDHLKVGKRALHFSPKMLPLDGSFRVGSLTVVEYRGKNINGARIFRCHCDCGNRWVIRTGFNLRASHKRGHNSACKDCRRERMQQHAIKYFEPAKRAALARGELLRSTLLTAPFGVGGLIGF